MKSNNEKSIAKIVALAERLNVVVERKVSAVLPDEKETIKNRILNFKASEGSSFDDAGKWQQQQREDRNLPFS